MSIDGQFLFTKAMLVLLIMAYSCAFIHAQEGGSTPGSPILPEFRDEVYAVGKNPKMISAFALIEEDVLNARSDLIKLTEIEAPPFKEDARAQVFAEMLRNAGLDSVWIDDAGNVIGLMPGKHGLKTVVLDGHLDTVFPEGTDVTVRERGDTLYAPGIADDTRALAMILSIVRVMRQADIEPLGDILFVGTVGEEGLGDLRGVKYLLSPQPYQIDSWISIDGGGLGRITNKGLGSYRYRISFNGPGGHSWGAFGLANPIHALGGAIQRFVADADSFITEVDARTTYNVGKISGGTSINSIPYSASMEVDIRSERTDYLDSLEVILENAVHTALEEQNAMAVIGERLSVEIDKIGNRPSGEQSDTLPLVQRAMAAAAFMGKVPVLSRSSTNANIPIALGVPAVTIGRGGKSAEAHSLGEWWYDDEGYKATQMALLLLIMEAGLSE